MKIWCLFSIANLYDQPNNNLVAWWSNRPSFEVILSAVNGSLGDEKTIIAAANLLQGRETKVGEDLFRLEEINEGTIQ